jgi:hypothetical protein
MKCGVVDCPKEPIIAIQMVVYIKLNKDAYGRNASRTVAVKLCEEHCTLPYTALTRMFDDGKLRVSM